MKIHLQLAHSPAEHKRRAQALVQTCEEFGAKAVAETGNTFSVEFPLGTTRLGVVQFVEAVQAADAGEILVSPERGDAAALGADPTHAQTIREAFDAGKMPIELLPEQLIEAVDGAQGRNLPESEAEQEKAYAAILESQRDDIFDCVRHDAEDPFGTRDLDKQLQDMHNSGEAAKWHRSRSMF